MIGSDNLMDMIKYVRRTPTATNDYTAYERYGHFSFKFIAVDSDLKPHPVSGLYELSPERNPFGSSEKKDIDSLFTLCHKPQTL